MLRVRVVGSGWTGGPSLNTFYFTDGNEDLVAAQEAYDRVHTAFVGVATIYPSDIPHTVDPQVDVMNPVNGDVTGTFIVDPLAVIPGGAPDSSRQAPHTALLVKLITATFSAGRKLQGRAFLSPLYSQMTDGGGTPTAEAIVRGNQFGLDLLGLAAGGTLLSVWRRPREADPDHVPPITARDGQVAPVEVVSTPDKFAVLRSRRD